MGLFGGKKLDRDQIIADGLAQAEAEAAAAGQEKKEDSFSSGNSKIDIEITKIKAQLESLNEVRKANSERFSRVSEQMGELRGMIMDTNKTMSKIEVSATKAIDLVESVQPEKLMIEIRKQEGKGEALKANIESNEAMMRDIMEELKKIRQQMNFYKGIEQVIKLNEEVKNEILDIKKVEATIERHADKSESIFLDLEKKYAEFDKFLKTVDEIEKNFHAIQGDFDNIKLQLSNKADKKEFLSLMDKFTEFEKHTGNIMKLFDERSKHLKLELKSTVSKIKEQLRRKQGIILDEKIISDDKLPAEEGEFIEKIGVAQKKTQTQAEAPAGEGKAVQSRAKESETAEGISDKTEATEPTQSSEPSPPSTPPPERKGEKTGEENERTGLMDVLKKRRIIPHKLSDEEEEKEQKS